MVNSLNVCAILCLTDDYILLCVFEICVTSLFLWHPTVTHLPRRGCRDLRASSKGSRLLCTSENLDTKRCTGGIVLITNHPASIRCKQHWSAKTAHTHMHGRAASTATCSSTGREDLKRQRLRSTQEWIQKEIKEHSSLRKVDKGTDGSLFGSYCS